MTELNNSVEDYNYLRVGVVCNVSSVSNFKYGIISRRFELEGYNSSGVGVGCISDVHCFVFLVA